MIGAPLGSRVAMAGMILSDGKTQYIIRKTNSSGVIVNSWPMPEGEEAIPFPVAVVADLLVVKEAH